MQKFLLLYRSGIPTSQPSPAQMQKTMEDWTKWLRDGIEQKIIAEIGDALQPHGKVLRAGMITDGPFMERNEISGGFSIAQGETIEAILTYVQKCPSISDGGSVEVRPMTGVGETMK